jgi:hypothetical protein
MSTPPDTELDLDSLFLPAWAQQPANRNLYAKYEGGEERRTEQRGDRPRRPFGDRQRGGPREQRGQRPGGPPDRRGGGKPRRDFQERGERRPPQDRPAPQPLPEIDIQFRPDEQGIDSLARQIKMTGRAYPLFSIALIVLEKPERHRVVFATRKKQEGGVAQPLFVCALDDTLWLSEEEAVAYLLGKHFNTFYQAERTPTEPPKGTYTFVAQCGMSGVILGPPNYHDYQNQLRKLHAERFSRMPFDAFKSRVKIVKDEAVVKKWIEDQSWKTEYVCLNVPEPLKLSSRDEVEKHFRATHLPNVVKQVESHQVSGTASRSMPSGALQRLVRAKWEEQQRFPLQLATLLSQEFAKRGLQFFKVNRTVTHVSVARPHYLDLETTPVSENVKRIVEFIHAHPRCSRRKLFETLAPAAVATTQPLAEGAAVPELSPEASTVISDLHWLVHQGHVIEFANGTLETAKKPLPKPVKPEPAAAAASESATAESSVRESAKDPEFTSAPNAVPGSDPAPVQSAEAATAIETPDLAEAEITAPETQPADEETKRPESPT